MSDVVIQLVGGLGNQLFQYATARALSLRTESSLVFDLSWFDTVSDRHYALAPFLIDCCVLSGTKPPSRLRQTLQRLRHRLSPENRPMRRGFPAFIERQFHFDPAVLSLRAPIYLEGYFQSERYFADHAVEIAQELCLISPPPSRVSPVLDAIRDSESVCLHVRRGDYVENPVANKVHGTCSLDYYRRGFALAAEGMHHPKGFVFSDDPQWVRDNLTLDGELIVVDVNGPAEAHEDLRLMAACQSFVIANSSLSWWGAWLGASGSKRVVAPSKWFSGGERDTSDLIPAGWLRC